MLFQCFILSMESSEVHDSPESSETHIFPLATTAASIVPSLEEVILHHFFVVPTDVSSVQVAPESLEVQIFP